MFTAALVAFYFSMMVPTQEWPVLVGPYFSWGECADVRELMDKWGHETDSCKQLPIPQDSVPIYYITQ